jgi:hypothetical protein
MKAELRNFLDQHFSKWDKTLLEEEFVIQATEPELSSVDDLLQTKFDKSISIDTIDVKWTNAENLIELALDKQYINEVNTGNLKASDLPFLVDEYTDNYNAEEKSFCNEKTFVITFTLGKKVLPLMKYLEKKPLKPIVLYYRLTLPGQTTVDSNSSQVIYQTIPSYGPLSQYKTAYMCESDFITPTTDLISFVVKRCAADDNLGIPPMFNVELFIISKPYQTVETSNMITAISNYVNPGVDSVTLSDYINYPVTAASGIYAGYTNVKIIFDNSPEKKRTVIIT